MLDSSTAVHRNAQRKRIHFHSNTLFCSKNNCIGPISCISNNADETWNVKYNAQEPPANQCSFHESRFFASWCPRLIFLAASACAGLTFSCCPSTSSQNVESWAYFPQRIHNKITKKYMAYHFINISIHFMYPYWPRQVSFTTEVKDG